MVGRFGHRTASRVASRPGGSFRHCGSIPACAGEPRRRWTRLRHAGVYPRVCGGTAVSLPRRARQRGLSPRVRGNLGAHQRLKLDDGSIPACAGEPVRESGGGEQMGVYPRVCGGTPVLLSVSSVFEGLSPRVRGNRGHRLRHLRGRGSIPACAGEPRIECLPRSHHGVYPRVCGGTRRRGARRWALRGLSPRVRGNQLPELVRRHVVGSIPACAGEPLPDLRRAKNGGVCHAKDAVAESRCCGCRGGLDEVGVACLCGRLGRWFRCSRDDDGGAARVACVSQHWAG